MYILILMGLLLLLLGGVAPAAADPYYNSSEPGCNGSDPNVFFCDDFEDGDWFYNTEQAGQREPRADGWGAPITSNPTGAARCGAGVTPFGNCAATGGSRSGVGGANMGMHFFKTSTCGTDGTQLCPVPEVYVRWYAKWDAGYQFGAEKHLNVTNDTGDIAFANVQLNCAASGSSSTANVKTQVIHGDPVVFANCGPLNVSDLTIQSGRWYFFEYNVRANNSPAGIGRVRLWVNDCGVDGKSCGATPILRTDRTGSLPGNSNGSQITTIWLENWANPPSSGTGPLWDQIKASRVGPIGFAGTGTGPPPTGTYTLTTDTTGAGAVSGAGTYPSGAVVTPVALPASGSTFSGWSGDCTGPGACTVTMTANKAVTATFTGGTTPPPTTCAITPTPAAITFTHPPGGPLPAPQSVRVVTSDGSAYRTFDTGFYDAAPCYTTSCPSGTLTTITPMPTTLSLAAGTYTYPLNVTAGEMCPKVTVPVVLTIGAPAPPSTGMLTVTSQISRCNYFLTAIPPDGTGGWVAQFYRDGTIKVGAAISTPPYKRSLELYAPSHSFTVQFTKTGTTMRSPAEVTRVCP